MYKVALGPNEVVERGVFIIERFIRVKRQWQARASLVKRLDGEMIIGLVKLMLGA